MKVIIFNKKHLLWIVFACVLAYATALLAACGVSPTELPQDIIVHDPLSENAEYLEPMVQVQTNGDTVDTLVGVNLSPPDDRVNREEYRLSPGQPLTLDLGLTTGKDATFLVTLLVDYQQTPFVMDGQMGLLHQVDVIAGKDLAIPIQVEINGSGAHDLMVVAFRDPYQSCRTSGNRAVVIVGDNEEPVRQVQPDAVGNPPPSGVDWGSPLMFTNPGDVHPSQGEGQMRLTQRGRPGQTFDYRIWMSNLGDVDPEPEDFGLVGFLNYRQIDLKGKELFAVHLDEKQEVLIEDSLVLPAEPGIYEFQIVYVVDPYKSLLNGEVSRPFVYASDCLGIEIP